MSHHAIILGILGVLVIFGLYKLINRAMALRAIDGPTAPSTLYGHMTTIFDPVKGLALQDELLNTYGSTCKIKGVIGEDQLWISDPRAMYEVIIKAHDDFQFPNSMMAWMRLLMGSNIITATGHKHKMQRKVLNPVFTVAHMRNLTETMTTITHHLEDIVESKVNATGGNTGVVDIYKWMNYVALEMIGQAGMGYSFGVMQGKESEYLNASHDMYTLMYDLWYITPLLPWLEKIGPMRSLQHIVDFLPFHSIRALKEVSNIMHDTAIEIYRQKKAALANGNLDAEIAAGKDIMSSLLRQNEVVPVGEQMSEEEVISQVNAFIFAGHDTTSAALSRTLLLLAQHPDIQAQLHAEVQKAHQLYGKNLSYDHINSLVYLEAVCRESLRLHSPAPFTIRVAHKDMSLPLLYPASSKGGKSTIDRIAVKKGMCVYLSLDAANRDKRIWGEDADQFRPARWLEPLPPTIEEAKMPSIYSSTMTFLGGPRACLGFKFSQLEMKLVLSNLISSFKFEMGEDVITWRLDSVVKPYVWQKSGDVDRVPSMPLKVTVLGVSS